MKLVLNLAQWFRRKCGLTVLLFWDSGSPFVQQSVTICAILVEDIKKEQLCEISFNLDQ